MNNLDLALIPPLKVRCSSIVDIIGKPKTGDKNQLSQTGKSAVQMMLKENLFGYKSFKGDQKTEKGILLEEQAIELSGLKRFLNLSKNTERRSNNWITGECDVYVPEQKLIIDEKCPWGIGTHPFFKAEAEEKVKKSGYDWQMQGYMWLWDCDEAQVDFVLLPTPLDLLTSYDNIQEHIDLVEQIPESQRITTVTIKRDDKLIERIQERVEVAQEYYQQLINELGS